MVRARRDGLDRLGIAAQLVHDHDTWFAVGSNQSAEETLCGFSITVRLDPNIEYISIAIDRKPQPMFHAVDRDDRFVHMPFVVRPGPVASNTSRELRPETVHPETNRFTTDDDTTLRQKVLDIRRAKSKPMISAHRIGDDFARKRKPFSRGNEVGIVMVPRYPRRTTRSTWQCRLSTSPSNYQ